MTAPQQAHFQLVLPGTARAPDLLGLWQPVPGGLAFDAQAEPFDGIVWRVQLPEDRQTASAQLNRQAALLQATERSLPLASQRLRLFVQEARRSTTGLSFSAGPTPELMRAPERELAVWLQQLSGAVDYGLLDWVSGGVQETVERVEAFLDQLRRSLTHYAWVETVVGGTRLGRTAVSWLGDVETVWRAGLGRDEASLHQRALALALASRAMWLRMVSRVMQGALQLAGLAGTLATPGGAILAFPAAWKFIRQVVDELRQLQEHRDG